jgi:hypothetical protein
MALAAASPTRLDWWRRSDRRHFAFVTLLEGTETYRRDLARRVR